MFPVLRYAWFDGRYMFASAHEVLSDKGVDMPVVMLDSLVQTVLGQVVDVATTGAWSDSADSRAGAAVPLSLVVDIPVMVHRPIRMVFLVRKTIRDSPQYFSWWSMSLFCMSCRFLLLSVLRQSSSHKAARRHPYRCADADSHGPFYHRVSPAAVH